MSLTAILIALFAGAAGLLLLESFIRKPTFVAVAILVSQVTTAAVATLPSAHVGPFRFSVDDIIAVGILAAAVARFLRLPRQTPLQWAALSVLGMALVSLARGVLEFGVAASVNQSRVLVPFLVATVYFSTVVPSRATLARITRLWLLAASALSAVAILRWGAMAIGFQGPAMLQPTASFDRVLNFHEALVVTQAALLALVGVLAGTASRLHRWLAYSLLPIAVLLQHRTAWAALLVGLGVMVILDKRIGRRLALALCGVAVIGALVSLVFFDLGEETVAASLSDTATTTGTFEWRVEGWRQLLATTETWGAADHAVGDPLGASFRREISGSVTESQPHNYYLHLYLRTGSLGLSLMGLLYAGVLMRLRRTSEALTPNAVTPPVLVVFIFMQLTLFVSYAPATEQGILFGLAIATAGVARGPGSSMAGEARTSHGRHAHPPRAAHGRAARRRGP